MSVNGHGSIHLNKMKEKERAWKDEESNQNTMADSPSPASPFHLMFFTLIRIDSWLTNLINDSLQLFRRIILNNDPAALGRRDDAHLGAERFLELFFNRFELVA